MMIGGASGYMINRAAKVESRANRNEGIPYIKQYHIYKLIVHKYVPLYMTNFPLPLNAT